MEVRVIRSDRRTFSAEIKNGNLLVRAPRKASDKDIKSFLDKNRNWIETHLAKSLEAQKAAEGNKLTEEDIRELADMARKVIPERVEHYAPLVGVSYGKITIRNQRTRWGSCSSKGNLNFNCLLMLTPPEVIDSVIVHELCHRKEMNHSERFYAEVLRVFPDYRKWDRWLKDNGAAIMARVM
jgi:hypothetical protein